MSILQAIKSAFASVARNIQLFIVFVCVSLGLMTVVVFWLRSALGPELFAQLGPGFTPTDEQLNMVNWWMLFFLGVFWFCVQSYINGGIIGSVKDIVKTNSFKLNSILKYSNTFFLRFVLFGFIMFLLILILSTIFMFLGGMSLALIQVNAFLGVITGLVIMAGLLLVYVALGLLGSLAPVVIISECQDKGWGLQGFISALGKGFKFIKKILWKTVGLALALWGMLAIYVMISRVLLPPGGALGFVAQLIGTFLNLFLSLVYIASFVSFYLGNSGNTPPPAGSETAKT